MDPVTSVRELLPAWTLWLNLPVAIALGFVLGALGTWLPTRPGLKAFRAAAGAHWTERARLAWPVRTRLAVAVLALPLFGLFIGAFLFGGELSYVPPLVVGLGSGAGATLGSSLVGWRVAAQFREERRGFGAYVKGIAVEWVLRRPHLAVLCLALVGLSTAVVGGDTIRTILWAWPAALLFLAAGLLSGLPILIPLRIARPLPEPHRGRVFALAEKMCVRLRSAYVVPWPVANALALIYTRQIVFTEKILEVLDADELDAVTAHELGHVGEPMAAKVGRGVVVVLFSVGLLALPALAQLGLTAGLAVFLAIVVGALAVRKLARRMEERADKLAAEHTLDATVYSRALEKLYEANLVPAVMGQRGRAHPDLWDRMVNAGVVPDYDKPRTPPKAPARWGLLLFVIVMFCGACPLGVMGRAPLGYSATAAHWSIAVAGGHETALQNLAAIAEDEGRLQDMADYDLAAAHVSGYRSRDALRAVESLALAGDCDASSQLTIAILETREVDPNDRDSALAILRGRCPDAALPDDPQVPMPAQR